MTAQQPTPLPRYDFYQTPTELILALYVKGYDSVRDRVRVDFSDTSVQLTLPPLDSQARSQIQPTEINLSPLAGKLEDGGKTSTYRVLSSKIEIKLRKAGAGNWAGLLGDCVPTTTTTATSTLETTTAPTAALAPEAKRKEVLPPAEDENKPMRPVGKKEKKNWDNLDIDDEEQDASDPNAGGDAALQKFFSQLYGNADEDTRRAMIKSFTESGGTTLSTDWGSIGKETTPVRPPEGVEEKKY